MRMNLLPQVRIFLDMDGTISDFDQQFMNHIGVTPEHFVQAIYKLNQMTAKIFNKNGDDKADTKQYIKDISQQMFWEAVNSFPQFWDSIPPVSGFEKLWHVCKGYNTSILTSVPVFSFLRDKVILGKRNWLDTYMGKHIPMYVTFFDWNHRKTHKEMLCTGPFDILIDNTPENVDAWIKKKGVGILFKTPEQTIKELESFLILYCAKRANPVQQWYRKTFKPQTKQNIIMALAPDQKEFFKELIPNESI